MTIRTSPPISLADVMAELRITNPGRQYPIALGDADVRALAGKPSGPISLSDLYGRSSYVPMTVYATDGYDFQTSQNSGGSAQASAAASVQGGRGTKFFNWVILGNPSGASISGQATPVLTASKTFVKTATGGLTVTARCDVTDETGAVASSSTVSIVLEWASTA